MGFEDSLLAQHIWGRYGSSPGVVSLDGALQLARQATRFGVGRLPLLADVQRRWSLAGLSLARAWPAMPYVRWATSPADESAPPHPTDGGVRRLPRARVASLAQPGPEPGLQRAIRSGVASSAPMLAAGGGTDVRSSGIVVPPAEAMADLLPGTRQPSAGSTTGHPPGAGPPPARSITEVRHSAAEGRAALPAADDGSATPTASGIESLGTVIMQRYLSGPAGRAAQYQAVGATGAMRAAYSAGHGPGDLGRAILQRRAGSSVERVAQEQPVVSRSAARVGDADRPEVAPPAHPPTGPPMMTGAGAGAASPVLVGSSARRAIVSGPARHARGGDRPEAAPPAHSPTGTGPPIARAGAAPSVAGAADVGAVILQRHLDGPGGRAVQREAPGPAAGAQVTPVAAGSVVPGGAARRRLSRPAERAGREQPVVPGSEAGARGGVSSAVAGGDWVTAIQRRRLDSPAGETMPYNRAGHSAVAATTTTPEAVNPGGSGSLTVQSALPAPRSPAERAAAEAMATASNSRDLGASIMRRYLYGVVEQARYGALATPGTQPFFASAGAARPHPVAGAGQTASSVVAATSSLKAIALRRNAASPADDLASGARESAFPFSGLEAPWLQAAMAFRGPMAQRAGEELGGGGESSLPWPEMPLARATDYSGGAGKERAMGIQRWSATPTAPPGVLQREQAGALAAAGASAAAPPQAVGETSPPGGSPPGPEGLDLERLADEVYAIIERRLIVERESRGL